MLEIVENARKKSATIELFEWTILITRGQMNNRLVVHEHDPGEHPAKRELKK